MRTSCCDLQGNVGWAILNGSAMKSTPYGLDVCYACSIVEFKSTAAVGSASHYVRATAHAARELTAAHVAACEYGCYGQSLRKRPGAAPQHHRIHQRGHHQQPQVRSNTASALLGRLGVTRPQPRHAHRSMNLHDDFWL